jgi:predicted AAA+ superfamily ATPase
MTDLLFVRRLNPWTSNVKKRLVKSPKIYVHDSGLAHALLNIQDYNTLLGDPVVDGSWEEFVVVIRLRCNHIIIVHLAGEEIGLVIEYASGSKWAIEIKRSSTPYVSRGMRGY